MDLSVIIVSFNVSEYLKQCLISVRKAAEFVDCEIFVIDNNSADNSCEMVKKEFPEVNLIINTINSGFSSANNQAINKAKGRFVLLLNPDTIIESDSFSRCIDFMNSHADAGALGVKMVDGDGIYLPESKRAFPDPLTAFFKTFGLSSVFPRSPFFNRYYLTGINADETAPTEAISGAFMFIRMEAMLKTGNPDEDFFMYGEDIDLSLRIKKAGYNNYYFPEVCIVHFKGRSTSRDHYTDIRHFYNAMRIYTMKRQREKFTLFILLVFPAIYIREAIALVNRFFRITFRK